MFKYFFIREIVLTSLRSCPGFRITVMYAELLELLVWIYVDLPI